MPIIPTGGLSIFLNVAILAIGFVIKKLKYSHVNMQPLFSFFALFTEKRFDTPGRKFLGYGVCASICAFMIVATTSSLVDRLQKDSNYDIAVDAIHFVEAKVHSDTLDENMAANIKVIQSMSHNAEAVHTDNLMVLSNKQSAPWYQTTKYLVASATSSPTNLALLYIK